MRTKVIASLLLGGLLGLAFPGLNTAQAHPQWDYCADRMNSKGETTPRYNHTRHRMNDGDWCWGHGHGHHGTCHSD